jgi:hypothetical protein
MVMHESFESLASKHSQYQEHRITCVVFRRWPHIGVGRPEMWLQSINGTDCSFNLRELFTVSMEYEWKVSFRQCCLFA